MSVKIYNAYRVNHSWAELVQLLHISKEIIHKKVSSLYLNRIEYIMMSLYDLQKLGYSEEYKMYLSSLLNTYHGSLTIASEQETLLDLQTYLSELISKAMFTNEFTHFYEYPKVVCIPYQNEIFLIYFGKDSYLNILKQHLNLEDFHYQNSTDQPDNISDTEWSNRREIWENIFESFTSTPNDVGFTYSLINPSYVEMSHRDTIESTLTERIKFLENIIKGETLNPNNLKIKLTKFNTSPEFTHALNQTVNLLRRN